MVPNPEPSPNPSALKACTKVRWLLAIRIDCYKRRCRSRELAATTMLLSRGAGLSRPSSVCNSATQVRTTHVVTHRLKSAGLALRQTPQYQLLDTIGVGSGTCVPVTTPHSHVALLQQLYDAADEVSMVLRVESKHA